MTMTLLVLNGPSSCGGQGAAAFMGTNISFYNQLSERTVSHELSHNWGNGHQMVVDCSKPFRDADGNIGMRRVAFYDAGSIQQSFKDGCGIQKDIDGRPMGYASYESVMGSGKPRDLGQLYSPHELNRIYPERFRMPELADPYGKHYLSMDEGGNIGIKIPVPEKHALTWIRDMFRPVPLLPVDETITGLAFGLQYKAYAGEDIDITDPAANFAINPVALGKRQSYVVDTQLFSDLGSYPHTADEREAYRQAPSYIKAPIIYMDEELDLVVSIGRDSEKNYAPYVLVQTYEETKAKRKDLKEEVEKRNAIIFDDDTGR